MTRPTLIQLGKYYHPEVGGMETHLYDQCTELKERFEIEVIVANRSRRTVREDVDGIDVTRVANLGEILSTPVCPTYPLHVRRAARRPEGIVHIHLPNPIAQLAYRAVRPAGRLVVTWHSDVVRTRALSRFYHQTVRGILARADRIIVTSPAYLEASATLSRWREKCVVIPLGVDLGKFRRTAAVGDRVADIRSRFGGPLVLFVGRLVYYKGLDVLVDAASRIDGRVLIVGDGPWRARLVRAAAERKLQDRVAFLSHVSGDDLVACYHACDVLVLPSNRRSEAFGIVQLEAMACSKPVVSTSVDTGVPWVNQDGETGVVVPIDDPHRLAEAVNHLLGADAERARLGGNGRARVEALFSREVVAARTAEVYEEVSSGAQSPGP